MMPEGRGDQKIVKKKISRRVLNKFGPLLGKHHLGKKYLLGCIKNSVGNDCNEELVSLKEQRRWQWQLVVLVCYD